MTKNQLTVPEISEQHEELVHRDELVQQVLDNPRDLSPSVQVRFAKRVGRPGNSRVMMMDAQTCGPIGEDGEDSESKLALKLADGTNVQLSLSFFNENQPALAGVGGGGGGRRTNFSPFNSYVYEPRTYSVSNRESNQLPAIMFAMTFMLGAACYGMLVLTGQVHDQLGLLQKLQMGRSVAATAATKPSVAKIANTKSAAAAAAASGQHAASSKAAIEPVPAPPPVTLAETEPKFSLKKTHSRASRSHEQTQVTHLIHRVANFSFHRRRRWLLTALLSRRVLCRLHRPHPTWCQPAFLRRSIHCSHWLQQWRTQTASTRLQKRFSNRSA